MSTLSLVLPCYNEEENVPRTVRACLRWFDAEKIQGEVIAVDDGSKDRTGQLLEDMAKDDRRLKVFHHQKNRGYGNAIATGCDAATMDVIAYMDSDGQFRPEDLSKILPFVGEYRFVSGRRRHRADGFVRNSFGKVLGLMNWLVLGLWVRDVNCGMKAYERSLWQLIKPTVGYEKLFNTEMYMRLKVNGIAWKTVDVPHYPRLAGNPTGAKLYVIVNMFKELIAIRRVQKELVKGKAA